MVRGFDVTVFGDLNVDVILKVPTLPPEDTSVTASETVVAPGGVAGNMASNLVREGLKVSVIAGVGDDLLGRHLLSRLEEAGIWGGRVRVVRGCRTGVMVVIITPGGRKYILGSRGANEVVEVGVDEALEAAYESLHIHVSGYTILNRDGGASAITLLRAAAAARRTSSVDLEGIATQAPWRLKDLKGLVTYAFLNRAEALKLCGGFRYPIECAERLLEALSCRAVFIKLGPEGSAVAFRSSEGRKAVRVVQRDVVKDPVDTTGAGDAFNAAALAALLRGEDPRVACVEGNRAGADACRRLGGWAV